MAEDKYIKLATWREKKGWTQSEMAFKLGCHRVTVASWETNGEIPRRKFMKKILEITNGEVEANSFYE